MDSIKEQIISTLKDVTGLDEIRLEVPPNPEMGDFAFPCFPLTKQLKKAPTEIAKDIQKGIKIKNVEAKVIGPYINFFIDKSILAEQIIKDIEEKKTSFGCKKPKGEVVLVESPGPNTNKPLHLGHLRNILLGQSIARILKSQGKDVKSVNVVNDRGVHICKSMLAYKMFADGKTPESENKKSDHFVGDMYVEYAKAEKDNPEMGKEIQDLLVKWEEGDKDTIELWKKMNKWALDGFQETYEKLNFNIDKEYLESETYKHGKDIIEKGLKDNLFEKDDDGNIVIRLKDKNMGTKVLLRANGTSVYITQDIYMAKLRYDDYKFDEMIYVVGNEQDYHFKVLFEVFEKLKWKFAGNCKHFSYGMVELPEGKMKSREGTVVDTDNLIDEVTGLAREEIKKRYDDLDFDEEERRANAIAMSAIRFFILKFDPVRNFVFNPKESLAFEGETGPYVQYAYARICSIFRKLEDSEGLVKVEDTNLSLLDTESDRKLLTSLSNYPTILEESAKNLKPSTLCHYLFDLASTFNEYYRDISILKAETKELRNARLALLDATRTIIKSGLGYLGIDVLEQM
ncbi:arginine--tRNA ligase [Candidatus Woesearchaeota archaeon]|nr:arginine--tRNA ligase [Candidatus Woesearchaeota archaeon]